MTARRSLMRVCGGALPLLLGLASCLPFQSTPHRTLITGRDLQDVGESVLRYEQKGKGPPVLFIHGFGSTLESWSLTTPSLMDDHTCVGVDLKGFGRSSKYDEDYSLEAMSGSLLGLLDALGHEQVDLVAHSYGSSVALTFAKLHPDRVGRIVLTDAFVYSEQMPWYFSWARSPVVGELLFGLYYSQQLDWRIPLGFYDPSLTSHEMVKKAREVLALPGTRASALAIVRGMELEWAEKGWSQVKHPTLLVWGREDEVTPLMYGERLSKHLPHARLEVIPWTGHFPMLEAPGVYNDLVGEFLGARP